ncbi:MAG: MBL fold metallo-hydrolase [Candidatus Altiarchaeia archaeon]
MPKASMLLECVFVLMLLSCIALADTEQMSIHLLGTGAADSSSWKTYGRQLSSILVNKDLLVDLSCWTNDAGGNKGTCGVARLNKYGVDKNAINYVLITHHHLDHFDTAQIVALAQARTSATKMTLYGGVTVVSQVNSYLASDGKTGLLNVVHLEPYVPAAVGPYTVTPLIANHDTPGNEPYVYMIKYYGKQFLYGTDSGVLAGTTLSIIYATKFDQVIRERTFASDTGVAHMDKNKVAAERADWIAHGVITASTPYALTHIAYCRRGSCSIPSGTTDVGDGAKLYVNVSYSPIGYFDGANCNIFNGWTCDSDDYSMPLGVHFYVDGPAGSGSFLASASSNVVREQAVADLCGGYANHGFSFTTPGSLKDGRSHTIYAYAINIPVGTNPLLGIKTLQCTTTTTTSTTTTTTTTTSTTTSSSTSTTATTTSSTTTTTSSTTTTSTTTSSTSSTSTTTSTFSSSSSTSTTSTSTSSTTSSTVPQCVMPGNSPPCEDVSLLEVVGGIYKWFDGIFGLGEVIDLIDSWADPMSYLPA